MGEADSHIFVEDLVLYAMRKRGKNWKRVFFNIKDDDTDISRIFTPGIGKAVLHCAMLESWSYVDVIDYLVQGLLQDKTFSYGKVMYCLRIVGLEYLDLDKLGTLFSYCAMIVEVCCYCEEKGYTSLIEAAILASSMAMNVKLKISTETDRDRYHRYAVEYNKLYEDTFPANEQNWALKTILELGNELPIRNRSF